MSSREEGNSLPRADQKLKVLFIGGFGRSGTTLLERSLGQIEGFCAVGEIRHIWDRSLSANELCGCGVPFRRCEFWTAVFDEAYGGFTALDADNLVAMKYSVDRTRYIPSMIAGSPGAFRQRFADYQEMISRLYRAIQKISGCRVIIDSSKEPSYGFILRSLSSIDLHVLHVIRDSRAVAFSWLKKKRRPDVPWKNEIMHRYSTSRSIGYWLAFNTLLHSFELSGGRYRRLHYEDMVTDVRGSLNEILSFLGEPSEGFGFLRDNVVDLGTNHTVSGNPMRFERGPTAIRLDTEWRREMSRRDRRLVTLLTLPHLLGYGYLSGRGRPPLLPTASRDGGSA